MANTEWIPVTEKIPENGSRVLAFIVNQHDDKLAYQMVCEYLNDEWYPDDECASDNVIAWMPLPEPYNY